MANKPIMIGLVAIAFVAGSIMTSTIAYASDHPNGTPFLQEEIDAIIEIVEDLQDQLNNIHVTWDKVTDKPSGFADNIDNDTLLEISTSCMIDQIAKWDGTQWFCTDSASNADGGEVALRKLDCILIGSVYDKPIQFNFENGCNLTNTNFDTIDISGTNLSGADLTDSSFDEGNLSGVDFSGANLSNVDFYSSDLSGVDFSDADISGANFFRAFAYPPCTGNEICDTLPTS